LIIGAASIIDVADLTQRFESILKRNFTNQSIFDSCPFVAKNRPSVPYACISRMKKVRRPQSAVDSWQEISDFEPAASL